MSLHWELLARMNTHPLRLGVLEVLTIDNGRRLSVQEIAAELQTEVATAAHHVTALRKTKLLKLVKTVQRRGATEHYYELTKEALADEDR